MAGPSRWKPRRAADRPPRRRQPAGARAERRAGRFLARRGFLLIATNYRCRLGELDLVGLDGDTLAVVEVRYRGPGSLAGPAESLTRTKQARIVAATRHFLMTHPAHGGRPVRFDLVAISGDGGENDIEWLRGAFRPD